MTFDQLALSIMLSTDSPARKQARLTALAKQARGLLSGEAACPCCGSHGPHEDNGASRVSELTYLCVTCGEQFDAATL